MIKQRVLIWESERGWGRRVDEEKYFDSVKEAREFVKAFNSENNQPSVPDWYMFAELSGIKDV